MGYDLFQNENFKAMLNFFVETQTPSNPAREAESGQTGYFVGRAPAIGDEIGENSEADLIDWSNGEITVFPQKQPIPLRKSFMRSL